MIFSRHEAGFRCNDGAQFDWAEWRPAAPPRAVIIALHGLGGRMEQFVPLGEHLAPHGITTEAWNLRGQGLDPVVSRRGAALEVDRLLQDTVDFIAFARNRHPDLPLIIAGDSMGSQLALLALADPEIRRSLAGGLLFVPVIGLRQTNPAWLQSGLRVIGNLFPNFRLSPKWFVNRKPRGISLSRVPERAAELDAAPYRLREFSISFLGNMGLLIEQARATGPQITAPLAQFSAGVDLFLTDKQSRDFFDTIASEQKSYFDYPEAHHDLLHDPDADQVLRDAANWMEEILNSQPTSVSS